MQKDSILEKSMPKQGEVLDKLTSKNKSPLIKIDLVGFVGNSLAKIGAWVFLFWLIAVLIAAIRATHIVEG